MGEITVVGLGPGNIGNLTVKTLEIIQSAPTLLLRTAKHPAVQGLVKMGIKYTSYDYVYETAQDFEEVYRIIALDCITKAEKGESIVYAVPGSPQVAERTVVLLRELALTRGIKLNVLPGMSFLDVLFNSLEIDPITGLSIIDGNDCENMIPSVQLGLIITQVYSRQIASNIKLSLMNYYADDQEVVLAYHLGLPDENIQSMKLYQIDRLDMVDHLTSLYVPAVQELSEEFNLQPLIDTMARLRSSGGCPWDIEQTHASLRRYMVEEVYEVLEAIDLQDTDLLCEELGDLLLQVVFHARIAEECGTFTMQGVIEHITEKLIRRHPHVFGNISVHDAAEVIVNWEQIKKTEKTHLQRKSVLDGVSPGLPALMRAYKLQAKAAKVGFDWTSIDPAWDKVFEEINELKQVLAKGEGVVALEGELGDVLFSVVNVARFLMIDPEVALTTTNNKFIRRFSYIENYLYDQGLAWENMSLTQLDKLWEESKKNK